MEDATRRTHILAIGAVALAALASGCVGSVGTTASSMLRKVRESPDPNIRHQAYTKLASSRVYDNDEQKAEAARELSERLKSGDEPVASRAAICRTLGELKRPEARSVLLIAVNDQEPSVRASACRSLGKTGTTEDATILARIMVMDSDRDCQVAAIEGLAALKAPDPRIDAVLVDGMEHTDPAIRLASLEALRAISGKDLGIEAKPWKEYAEGRAKATTAAGASNPRK
jgi:HEAT repeat protein